jgi:hypothetical protein
MDTLSTEQLTQMTNEWLLPALPTGLRNRIGGYQSVKPYPICAGLRAGLDAQGGRQKRTKMEIMVLNWLYAAIRLNIKRGRFLV